MEEKVVYKRGWRDNYLSLKNLVRGRVYLTVEDQVMMYLGVAKSGKHLFYHFITAVTSVEIGRTQPESEIPRPQSHYNIITFANYEAQVNGIRQVIELSMASRADSECIVKCKKNPGIIGEFPCCHYEDKYLAWYKESAAGDPKMPPVVENGMKTDYVSVKDLVPGHFYYTGTGYVFCFLGRSSEGLFLWHHASWGNETIDNINNMEYLCAHSEATKSNKRCKPLKLIIYDEDAYGPSDYMMKIIEEGLYVDPQILDQGLIEQTVKRHTEGRML